MKRFLLFGAMATALTALPAAAASITTGFAGTNGFSGNMFNTTIMKSISIDSFLVNIGTGAATVNVYTKTGAFTLADETDPTAWTLRSSVSVTGAGVGNQTLITVSPFSLLAGSTYGFYLTVADGGPTMFYSFGSTTVSNADLTLAAGVGVGGQFGAQALFNNRTWNGTINYSLLNVQTIPEPSAFGLLALGLLIPAIKRAVQASMKPSAEPDGSAY